MTITVKNAGNTSTTLKINGTALTTGSASMATSSQHYATSSFTYGGAEQALQEAATTVAGWLVPDPPMGSTWLTTTALPHTLMDTGLVVHNQYIYAIGGYDDDAGVSTTSTVRFAALSGNGTVGTWNTSTPLPAAAAGSQIVATWGNYLYYVGGMTNGTAGRTTVYFTTFNSDGTLNSWSTTTPLTVAKGEHQVFQKDGYIYAIGGRDGGGSYVATSYFARLNATGSISNWSSTAALPTAVSDARGFIKNGYIFSAGGRTGSAAVSTINASLISATGSLNAWAGVGNLPAAIQAQATVLNDDLVYTFGGALHDWSNRTSSVFFATLGGGTTFGDWEQMGNFPVPIDSHASLVANGYLYSAGGEDNSSAVTTVRYLSLSSRDTYWGVSVSSSAVGGNYSSTITYTAIWTP
jgi:N-acetylneuraminic acid mutarotase